jgi:SNF2 family DNA or RNA helicase
VQYDELRRHYRESLLRRVQEQGFGLSKMHLLEALLRLRQAACHPGLLDPKRVGDASAKLDLLMEQLADLREEGHQALVFSQFTSLLAVVRSRLDSEGVKYAYLDGATRNRQACVDAFQTITNARCF